MSDVLLLLSVEQLIHHKHEESTGKDFALLQSSVCLESCSEHQILIRIVSCSYMFCRIFMIRFDTSREFKSEHTLLREHRVVCFLISTKAMILFIPFLTQFSCILTKLKISFVHDFYDLNPN